MERRHFLFAALLGVLLASHGHDAFARCDQPAGTRKVFVRDFRAVGDGRTDDGPAIRAAIKQAIDSGGPVTVEFEPNRKYRVASFEQTFAFRIAKVRNFTIRGNGAELVILPPNKVMSLSESSGFSACDLAVDYSPLPFTQGRVVSVDSRENTMDVAIASGFDVPEPYGDRSGNGSQPNAAPKFGIPYAQPGSFDRRFHIRSITPTEGRTVRVEVPRQERLEQLGRRGSNVLLPTTGLGQVGNFAFQVTNNDGVEFNRVKVYAYPEFAFLVADNVGPVTFNRVEVRPRPGTERVMTGWRDVFHVKDNRAPLNWEGCHAEGAFDDTFNLSAMYQHVLQDLGRGQWRIADLSRDGPPRIEVGDRMQAIDLIPERRLLGVSKVTAVSKAPAGGVVVQLSPPLPLTPHEGNCSKENLRCGSRLVNLDAANQDSVIRNCTISGSMRLRSKVLMEGSTFSGVLQIANSPLKEGPVPSGIVLRGNSLDGVIRIGSDVNAGENWEQGERWIRDVILAGNNISARIKAEGAAFQLVDNNFLWPQSRKLEANNAGPVVLRNNKLNGRASGRAIGGELAGRRNMSPADVDDR